MLTDVDTDNDINIKNSKESRHDRHTIEIEKLDENSDHSEALNMKTRFTHQILDTTKIKKRKLESGTNN